MPGDLEFRGFELTANTRSLPRAARRVEPGAVRIGVIADLRGRGGQPAVETAGALRARSILGVDRDNLDQVMRRLQIELELPIGPDEAAPVVLPLRELEDFHPDRILSRAAIFAELRSLRARLEDPRTFDQTAAELLASGPAPAPSVDAPPPADEPPPASGVQVDPGDLLDQILSESSPSSAKQVARPKPAGEWGKFLEGITAPHIVREHPRQAELVASVDAAMAEILREILHYPRFQALESLWRSLDLLTRRLETGPELTIELIDATRAELDADLLSGKPMENLDTYKLLVEQSVGTQGGRPWTILVANLTFGPSPRDIALLWRLGQVARLAGAPLLAAASPLMVGSESLAATPDPDDWQAPTLDESWSDLRHGAEAPYVGLALPRFLLRAPYGSESIAIDSFEFEEFPGAPAHESYLWGNPAFALAVLLGGAFDELGRFDPRRLDPELTDLPLPIERDADGEALVKPCAEVMLGHRAAERILAAGLMPLLSVRDRDAVRLGGLTSVADPPAPPAFS
jgi:type VI secretion system protein ImpC